MAYHIHISHPLRYDIFGFEQFDNLHRRFAYGNVFGFNDQIGMFGLFVRLRNAGEALNGSFACLLVQSFDIA